MLGGSSGEVTILGLLRAATSKDATGEGFKDDIFRNVDVLGVVLFVGK